MSKIYTTQRRETIMYRILIYCCLIYTVKSLPQSWSEFYNRPPTNVNSSNSSPKNDVEIFAPLFPPGRFIPSPKPLPTPPANPPNLPPKPLYPPVSNTPSQPYPPTIYPEKPTWTPKKPSSTTKIPPIYPPARKNPNFPPPIYPFFPTNPSFNPITTPKSTTASSTVKNSIPRATTPKRRSTKIPRITSLDTAPTIFPSDQTTITSEIPPSTTSSTVPSRTTVTPAWIYPPRPSWPRRPTAPLENTSQNADIVEAADTVTENYTSLNGLITEYQGYNQEDGSFQLGFQLQNGLSANVHGYMKDGKHILEGSYSLFTQDGKPVNVVYRADDSNYADPEPSVFHLDIPISLNFDDVNYDSNSIPTSLPHSGRIINVANSEDGQFSDLILQPTTEQDIEIPSIQQR